MSKGLIGERWGSHFRVCLSQLFLDILLSPSSKGGESRTTEGQRTLLQLRE
jgi:hypothetical protein